MKKYLIIIVAIAVLFGIPASMASVAHAAKKPATKSKTVAKKTPTPTKKPANKKAVKGTSTKKTSVLSIIPFLGLVDCNMPDGKTIKATKKDCDNVNNFWKKHGPSSNQGNSNNNTGGSSSGNSGGNSNNNPAPQPDFAVTNARIMPCTSTSCGNITTIEVTGTNFNANSRIELVLNSLTFSDITNYVNNPDAIVTGGNGSTIIIMDFYNLPKCRVYNVNVTKNGQKQPAPSTISTSCI